MDEALDIFLLTYRSTPNPAVPECKSPSQAMFGRQIRTCFELLHPPPVRLPRLDDGSESKRRFFERKDPVYAKLYTKNEWRWTPGIICERVGDVTYNVWVEDRKLVHSHINQLRSRTEDSSARDPHEEVVKSQRPLPLHILLDAVNLSQPVEATPECSTLISPRATPVPVTPASSSQPASATLDDTVVRASSTPKQNLPLESATSSLPSPTSSTTSTEFESAVEADPVDTLPRRSSRVRRAPQWFDPYHLF